jgi:hypothetical protein
MSKGPIRRGWITLRRSPTPFVVGAAAATAFVLLSLADGGFEPGTWAAATILVWWIVVVSVLAGAWPRSPIPGLAAIGGLCLLGLTGLTAASMAWTVDLGGAYADTIRATGYLGLFVLAVIAGRAGLGRVLLTGLALGLLLVACLALLSRLEPGFAGGASEALGLEVSGGRLSYPLGYWNALGASMASALLLLTWLGARSPSLPIRALAVAAIPIPLLTLFFSGSRGAAVAAMVGLAALLVAGPRRASTAAVAGLGLAGGVPLIAFGATSDPLVNGAASSAAAAAGDQLLVACLVVCSLLAGTAWRLDPWISAARAPVLLRRLTVAGLVVAGIAAVVIIDPVSRWEDLDAPPESIELAGRQQTTRFASVGGSGRPQYWRAALDATRDEPLRGIGAGAYDSYWNLNGSLELSVEHAHSLFLESSAELGLGGLVLALGFFAAPAVAGIRGLRRRTAPAAPDAANGTVGVALALLAAGFVSVNLDWFWDLPAAFVVPVIAAALLSAPAAFREPRAQGRPRARRAVAVAVVVAGLGACVGSGMLFLAEEAIDASNAELAAGDAGDAADEARRAIDLLPFAAEPRLQLANAERRRRDYPAARRALDQAQERSRGDWRLWLAEAGMEFEAGRAGPGIYALNHARTLNPKAPKHLFAYPTALTLEEG